MEAKKRILFLLGNDFADDNRVKIEALALIQLGYDVTLHATQNPALPTEENIEGIQAKRCLHPESYALHKRAWKNFEKTYLASFEDLEFDLLHCHDFNMLVLGDRIRTYYSLQYGKKVKLVYDSHEYLKGYKYYIRNTGWTNKLKGMIVWNKFVIQEARLIQKVDALISVSQSICDLFEKRIKGSIKPILIRNMPSEVNLAEKGTKYFQDYYGLNKDAKIIIHTGNMFFSEKRFEYLASAINEFDNYYMVFIGSRNSIEEKRQYNERKKLSNKLLFHPQVPREEITYYCSMADIGLVYTWNPKWESYWNAMPNKMMDTSLAGLPMLTTSQPEFVKFINHNQNGRYFNGDRPNELKEAMKDVIEHLESYKEKAQLVRKNYSWEKEVLKLKELYASLLN